MDNWQGDLLLAALQAKEAQENFEIIDAAARQLGFETCSYGLCLPPSYRGPRTFMLSSYPKAWQKRYIEAGYVNVDPIVSWGFQSRKPLSWGECNFAKTPQFYDEAKSFGASIGWAKSTLDDKGAIGLLSLARPTEPLTKKELKHKERRMAWLTQAAHLSFCHLLNPAVFFEMPHPLTRRETEILQWTADGKTVPEIAEILNISTNTVSFHIKNAILKLRVPNKTAAVVRAILLGLLFRY